MTASLLRWLERLLRALMRMLTAPAPAQNAYRTLLIVSSRTTSPTASVTGILRRFWIGESAGHLGSVLARATMRRRRILAIEFGTCRSGRIGGASGSEIDGKGRSHEERGGSGS